MSFVEGRDIDEADLTAGRRVALVSETAARELWPGSSAIGKRLRKWNWDEWVTVVGVVKDVRHAGRQGPGSEFARDFYFAMDQAAELGRDLVVLAKPVGGLDPGGPALRNALREAAPDLPVYDLQSMASRLRRQESVPRLTAFLSSAYAGVALILAGLGLYTILTYAAERRRREIGLRMALGASGALIATELTREGLRTGFLGVAIGLVGSLAAAWGLRSILYRIGPVDLPTFLAAAVLLLTLALAGSGIPAVRAARSNPAQLLRGE
jgi:cell division protein FtsX